MTIQALISANIGQTPAPPLTPQFYYKAFLLVIVEILTLSWHAEHICPTGHERVKKRLCYADIAVLALRTVEHVLRRFGRNWH
jgi:hypothetical protein